MDLHVRVLGLRFRVWVEWCTHARDLHFRVLGLGFRVWV